MARAPDKRIEEAREMFLAGKKLIEIAELLEIPEGTVRSWKTRYQWDTEGNATLQKKKRNAANKISSKRRQESLVKEAAGEACEEPGLTDNQRLFCLYYVQYRNKVKAYQKAYQCSYGNACGNASTLWKNNEIQKEIQRLLEEYRSDIEIDTKDMFRWYLDIARADINDFVSIQGSNLIIEKEFDGTIVNEISQTQNGIKIKLNDRMKALEWLAAHVGLADEKQRAEIELLKAKANAGKDEKEDKLDKLFEQIEGALKNA